MVEWPHILFGGGGLILSLSILDLGLEAHLGERCETEFGRFWRNFEEGSDSKIEADPPKGRYVFVCTSFFVEARPKVRGWQEILWRANPRQAPGNCKLFWRLRPITGHSRSSASMACVVSRLCQSDPA
jgi:hypothetical protein